MSAQPPKHRAPIPVHFIKGRRLEAAQDDCFLHQTQHKVLLVVVLACCVWMGSHQQEPPLLQTGVQEVVSWVKRQWRPQTHGPGIIPAEAHDPHAPITARSPAPSQAASIKAYPPGTRRRP
ncbi:hypothetical protein [Acanthopleuribacter pedis]|uniref:Uncharacterized protein n=1 Tax=Acanthopleuribacter pedis TaxID=442870 RepID=A0A8J7Q335_9BACT|nr:hypothetical protein [Acanthopleuribacter pedis]MBO1317589.1 hypothetical protein [Acanthopleuribacter pedis]